FRAGKLAFDDARLINNFLAVFTQDVDGQCGLHFLLTLVEANDAELEVNRLTDESTGWGRDLAIRIAVEARNNNLKRGRLDAEFSLEAGRLHAETIAEFDHHGIFARRRFLGWRHCQRCISGVGAASQRQLPLHSRLLDGDFPAIWVYQL